MAVGSGRPCWPIEHAHAAAMALTVPPRMAVQIVESYWKDAEACQLSLRGALGTNGGGDGRSWWRCQAPSPTTRPWNMSSLHHLFTTMCSRHQPAGQLDGSSRRLRLRAVPQIFRRSVDPGESSAFALIPCDPSQHSLASGLRNPIPMSASHLSEHAAGVTRRTLSLNHRAT